MAFSCFEAIPDSDRSDRGGGLKKQKGHLPLWVMALVESRVVRFRLHHPVDDLGVGSSTLPIVRRRAMAGSNEDTTPLAVNPPPKPAAVTLFATNISSYENTGPGPKSNRRRP
jgi:hypothetical protein